MYPALTSHPHALDLCNRKFEKLTVEKLHSTSPRKWLCACECGNQVAVTTNKLTSGHTKSCGCLRSETGKLNVTHGKRSSPEYHIWAGMLARCRNPNNVSYDKYGGRGVRVCAEWGDFAVFLRDVGQRPSDKHTLERVDVNGDYCKSNVIWSSDMRLQAFNQNRKSNNTSGRSGVYWRKDRSRWVVETFNCGKATRHGSFVNIEDAVACRSAAELKVYGKEKSDE